MIAAFVSKVYPPKCLEQEICELRSPGLLVLVMQLGDLPRGKAKHSDYHAEYHHHRDKHNLLLRTAVASTADS
jgi:hypothetical protein